MPNDMDRSQRHASSRRAAAKVSGALPTTSVPSRSSTRWAAVLAVGLVALCATAAGTSLPPPPQGVPASVRRGPPPPISQAAADSDSPPPGTEELLFLDTTRQPPRLGWDWVDDDAVALAPDPAALPRRTNLEPKPTFTTRQVTPALPSPYDTLSAANFTGGPGGACANFYASMVANDRFKQCYPFSTLLESSQSFFDAQKSLVSITQTLDAACAAPAAPCATYLATVAASLVSPSACGADYQLSNNVVIATHNALTSYQTVYSATCLIDPSTSAYCFANAVTNLTGPANAYFYYLPLNMTLPDSASGGGDPPACGWCLRQTMAIYHAQAADRSLAVAYTYAPAAEIVNAGCGHGFANATLPVAMVKTAAAGPARGMPPAVWAAGFAALPWLL